MSRQRAPIIDEWEAPHPPARACDQPGCAASGEFRAPRSREHLGDKDYYWWFCLDHVRAYNAAWNYYAGMSEVEIERELRRDTVWQRPTWRLGWRVANGAWHDPLEMFGGHPPGAEAGPQAKPRMRTEEELALELFDLEPGFDLKTLKIRYRILVKRYHPDLNGGSKESEERLKVVTRAYRLLKEKALG